LSKKITGLELPWSDFIPHTPHPKQAAFLSLPHREAFYGGAGGGGKSDALLMGALQYVHVPNYNALLLRRSYTDLALPEALMDRAATWLRRSSASWNGTDKRWTFPSGATLTFGYLERDTDKDRYRSAAFQYIGFDELTEFRLDDYRFMFSRLRRLAGVTIPPRIRSASNPGGIGHDWVKRYFVDPGAKRRPFIKATLQDNPSLDRDDYRVSLSHLDPTNRARIERGDWSAREPGDVMNRAWLGLVEDPPERVLCKYVRAWDLAASEDKRGEKQRRAGPAYTAGVLMSRTRSGVYTVEHVHRVRLTTGARDKLILNTAKQDGRHVQVRIEQEPGGSGKDTIFNLKKLLDGFDVQGRLSSGSKVERGGGFATAAEDGRVNIVSADWNQDYLDELESVPGPFMDQWDATVLAYRYLSRSAGVAIGDLDFGGDHQSHWIDSGGALH
jgi:phage terminase large subunit-like protein